MLRPETRLSIRCSRDREAVLGALRERGEGTVEELARACVVRPSRVRAALRGEADAYSPELSFLALGLVRVRASAVGPVFALTPVGAAEADAIQALRAAGRPV